MKEMGLIKDKRLGDTMLITPRITTYPGCVKAVYKVVLDEFVGFWRAKDLLS